jgi:hypothetical protein
MPIPLTTWRFSLFGSVPRSPRRCTGLAGTCLPDGLEQPRTSSLLYLQPYHSLTRPPSAHALNLPYPSLNPSPNSPSATPPPPPS